MPTLRSALSHLYSSSSSIASSSQAHSYLIEFQSRNIRRKIHSLVQRENDSHVDEQQREQAKRNVLINHGGSSMYASLSFLLSSMSDNNQFSNHETEQLFCAQTVLHRLRRMKLSEAVDFEMEYESGSSNPIILMDFVMQCNHYIINESDSFAYWKEFTSFHCQQLSIMFQNDERNNGFVSLLNHVLDNYFNQNWNAKNAHDYYDSRWGYGNEMEERIKGELMLLFLATISYYNTYLHSILEKRGSAKSPTNIIGPLMNTLASGMAVVALRLRYTSSSVHNPNSLSISPDTTLQSLFQDQQQSASAVGTANNTPIVKMILEAVESVSQVALSMSLQQLVPGVTFDQMIHHLNPSIANHTRHKCLYIQLSSVPDALIGGNCDGGIRGRLSIDPKCIEFMNAELSTPRTGIKIVMDSIQYLLEQQQGQSLDISQHQLFFLTCERWAKSVPLPKDFVEQTISYSLNHILPTIDTSSMELIQHSFCSYLISIFESACMTITQIASFNVGLSDVNMSNSHPPGRKRQSSKSKKRQKEKLDSVTNDQHIQQAENEKVYRGDVACHAAFLSWDVLYKMFYHNLSLSSNEAFVAQGEGPIGCICGLVSACLPHIIKHQDLEIDKNSLVSFTSSAMQVLKTICSNSNSSVRALSFEHIPSIHAALVAKTASAGTNYSLSEIEVCVAKSLAECTIALAEQCAYPMDYFRDLREDNDEDLEIERNDVRDIVRALTMVDKNLQQVPLLILDFILQYCHEMIMSPTKQTDGEHILPPEPVVHILSSPAKSLQCLAEALPSLNGSVYMDTVYSIIQKALSCVSQTCEAVILAFSHGIPLHVLFPISRLTCICLASFSPFFSTVQSNAGNINNHEQQILERILGQFMSVAIESIKNLPELMDCSSLGDTAYDIRGAMRSPGGEDHVACIAIMRLVFESDQLALATLMATAKSKSLDFTSVLSQLAELHHLLQQLEMERGPGIFHGKGVTPKSRRVLLKCLCRFGLIASQDDPNSAAMISSELHQLFLSPLEKILIVDSRSDLPRAALVYCICEATYDLSSFPSEFCSQLFLSDHNPESSLRGTELIINTTVSGYKEYCTFDEPTNVTIQVRL